LLAERCARSGKELGPFLLHRALKQENGKEERRWVGSIE